MIFKSNVLREVGFSIVVYGCVWAFSIVIFFEKIGLKFTILLFFVVAGHIILLLVKDRVVSMTIGDRAVLVERMNRLRKVSCEYLIDQISIEIIEKRTFRGYKYYLLSISTPNKVLKLSGLNQGWSNEQITMIEAELKLKKR